MTNRDPARLPRCSWRLAAALIFAAASAPAPAAAQREPVLSQIKLPHSYYYREMYLPQLTSGPSSVAWSPDGTELVYAMQGSLWRQRIDSTAAQQLTAGPGYDYQPDWSPDGRWIAFSRYDGAALELFALEVTSGALHQLTNAGAVNVEPRWSPDGSKLAFVSTSTCGHFHIFVAAVSDGRIERAVQLTPERRSAVPRYYYSQVDHEISPSWSADGEEILFVSNRDRIYGSGALWRMAAQPGAEPRLVHDEETTWKARPDWARDGSDRVVYSSYLGRQWHQLWVLPAAGGLPIPLSYGEFDRTAARWAPDGRKIAYISNQEGNTSLWILELPGGNQRRLVARERRTLRPTARLRVTVLDQRGQPTAARVAVHDGGGRFHAPDDTWIHADDAFVRSERKFEAHYFHSSGSSELIVPAGRVTVEAMKGFERRPASTAMELEAGEERSVELRLARLDLPADWERWVGGDLHVHMNYGGTYRNDPERMVAQAEAEDLRVIHNLIVNKEQRIPDIAYFSTQPDPASNARTLLLHGQEFHTSYWGHLGLLGLQRNLLLPDYAAYPGTAVASLFPTNAAVADLAHEQGALVGYVHPFDFAPDPADRGARLTYALPADVALGKVDYYEAVGFSDHLITAAVWYRLLNCGFKLPAGGGTDA
ncbi:MAG TPA: CehA/McbA family metallohydrolase, partial [Acidobacteriota bacterium]